MLNFFRKYERYFFLVITIVIIISFSFFGTYSTLGSNVWREQIAFKAVDGREITRSDVDEMAIFLATDNEDKTLFGGVWGPNFLNNGVIRKDFFETGLGQQLALSYREDLQEDINKRLAKEKKYILYSHPQAPFLNVANIWNYFAPQMNIYFDTLRTAENGLDAHAFDSRVKLYLLEKQIPASTLRYILRYQEKQYGWLKPDDRLNQIDLSLFGYHTLEDWFGPYFTRLVSEFIINAAVLAENQGYEVSKAEALTDLVRNTQISYEENKNNPHLGVTSPEEYFKEQLRRLNIDQAKAIKIWQQVLLFRRYFHDAGANALVDHLVSQKFHHFTHEHVTLDLYRLPASLRLANKEDLTQLEVYLQAVAKQNKEDFLTLPQKFLSVSEVLNQYPELVQKRYALEVAQVSQKTLQARIGLRELWNWEVEDQNWQSLVKQFPILGLKGEGSREERLETLENLDSGTRSIIDAFAKQAIVKAHPEWIHQALNEATPEKMIVGLRTQGGKMPFSGLNEKEKRQELMRLLDEAPIGENVAPPSPLYDFSADHQVYYRIAVLDRASMQEILTFAEARSDGTLDEVGNRILEKYYIDTRGKDASLYQNEKKEWPPFKNVRDLVADQYLEKITLALAPIHKHVREGQFLSQDQAASIRFYTYLNKIKEALEKESSEAHEWVKEQLQEEPSLSLTQRPSLTDQWKIEKTSVTFNRQNHDPVIDISEALELMPHAWSRLKVLSNGDLAFYQMKERGETASESTVMMKQAREAQFLLGAEAQRHLMRQVLEELKNKNALSLAYLKIPMEEVPAQQSETMESGY